MATKPRITKLDDPANPYGKKRTPTRARTEGEKMEALARSRQSTPAKRTSAKPAEASRVHPAMRKANKAYSDAWNSRIARAVDAADSPKRKR